MLGNITKFFKSGFGGPAGMIFGGIADAYGRKRTAQSQDRYDRQLQEIMDDYEAQKAGINRRNIQFINNQSRIINPHMQQQMAHALLPAAILPNTDTQVAAIEGAASADTGMETSGVGHESEGYKKAMGDAKGAIAADIGTGGSGYAGMMGRTMGPEMQKLAAGVSDARAQAVHTGMGGAINEVARLIARDRPRQVTPGELMASTQKRLDAVKGPKKHFLHGVSSVTQPLTQFAQNQKMFDALSKFKAPT